MTEDLGQTWWVETVEHEDGSEEILWSMKPPFDDPEMGKSFNREDFKQVILIDRHREIVAGLEKEVEELRKSLASCPACGSEFLTLDSKWDMKEIQKLQEENRKLREHIEMQKQIIAVYEAELNNLSKIDSSEKAPDFMWLNKWRNDAKRSTMMALAEAAKIRETKGD